MRFTLLLLIFVLASSPADAHLIMGRRPLDAMVARADAIVVAGNSTPGTAGAGQTVFKMLECIAGACPKGRFVTMPMDDHAAVFDPAARYFLFLAKGEKGAPWRVVQNDREVRPFAADTLPERRRYAQAFFALRETRRDREARYLELLLSQLDAGTTELQEDAVQSLLRFPPSRGGEAGARLLHAKFSAERSENLRLAILAIAQAWDPAGTRAFLLNQDLRLLPEDILGRAIEIAGAEERGAHQACDWLADTRETVRAAAVSTCVPPDGAWPGVALRALNDPGETVRTAAARRFRKHPETKPAVREWALAQEKWWRRAYLRMTGGTPAAFSRIFTDGGETRP